MFVTKSTGAPFANQLRDADFNDNVLLLTGDGIVGANNSVFVDSSFNLLVIVPVIGSLFVGLFK